MHTIYCFRNLTVTTVYPILFIGNENIWHTFKITIITYLCCKYFILYVTIVFKAFYQNKIKQNVFGLFLFGFFIIVYTFLFILMLKRKHNGSVIVDILSCQQFPEDGAKYSLVTSLMKVGDYIRIPNIWFVFISVIYPM